MAETTEEATKELANIETSLNRVINQIRRSCIKVEEKGRLLDELNDIASEIHHMAVFRQS